MPRFPQDGGLPRPVLKWAGGKGQLLPELRARVAMANGFGLYHEPFVGGGALFFDLCRRDQTASRRARLSDTNLRLMEVYLGIRDAVEDVIGLLEVHTARHDKDHYYAVRAETPDTRAARAARVIYLNRTCFNGLYRENRSGQFNVPIGRYANPRICDAENLRAVAAALSHVQIEASHFRSVLTLAQPGDFVYFDPPYHPVSQTASFTAYACDGFGEADQRELAGVFRELTAKGVKALLSNSWTPLVQTLYAGYVVEQVAASRNVNSRADRRGKVPEALVRNYDERGRVLTV